MFSDLKLALRQLRRSPGFAMTAILTLALGIGANAAIFTLVDSILLQPLPFPQQDRLVKIGSPLSDTAALYPKGWVAALGQHSASFAAVSAYGADTESNVGDANSTHRVFGAQVMTNALDALGLHPALGQFFSPADALAEHDPVVVLSHAYWADHFASSRQMVGQTIRIDGISRRVIGILPMGKRFPYADTQFLIPVTFQAGDPLDAWKLFDLRAFGRLRAGVSPAQAQADLRRLRPALLPLFPWRMPDVWTQDIAVVPLLESQVGAIRPRLLLMFSAGGLILLIACANVATLMLARAAAREREMALRGALGAAKIRLVRQLLSESLVLAIIAGGVGLMTADASLQALVRLLPADTPRLGEVALRWPEFLFGVAVSLVTGVLFGLIPALRLSSPNLRDSLGSGSRSVAAKQGSFAFRGCW